MSSFDDREKAFERKFEHDQDLQFKVEVRRNKLLGLWVATELLGLSGAEADAYAKEVISSDFEEPGEEDVVRKIMSDLQAKNVDFSEHRLRHHMEDLREVAKKQIMEE
ncbi:MAG TPA: DUF1476 domain-containing protein [Kiloniellaceae bacterium]|nr:DUF1476 domain-containing protein [Kiloniellaceae bacterium]